MGRVTPQERELSIETNFGTGGKCNCQPRLLTRSTPIKTIPSGNLAQLIKCERCGHRELWQV